MVLIYHIKVGLLIYYVLLHFLKMRIKELKFLYVLCGVHTHDTNCNHIYVINK